MLGWQQLLHLVKYGLVFSWSSSFSTNVVIDHFQQVEDPEKHKERVGQGMMSSKYAVFIEKPC